MNIKAISDYKSVKYQGGVDDFDYLELVVAKTRTNLEKVFCLMKINQMKVTKKII